MTSHERIPCTLKNTLSMATERTGYSLIQKLFASTAVANTVSSELILACPQPNAPTSATGTTTAIKTTRTKAKAPANTTKCDWHWTLYRTIYCSSGFRLIFFENRSVWSKGSLILFSIIISISIIILLKLSDIEVTG